MQQKPTSLIHVSLQMVIAVAYGAAWLLHVPFRIATPCAMIGTSNFFELAVAVAISLFGLNSGAVLATVVGGGLVMLSVVAFTRTRRFMHHREKPIFKGFEFLYKL